MKIAIISLPLSYNYGGYLQCFALMETLRKMGHEVFFLQRENGVTQSFFKLLTDNIKSGLERFGLGEIVYFLEIKTNMGLYYKTKNFRAFVKKYIGNISPILKDTEYTKKYCEKKGIEAYITGSDQIWRGKYSRSVNDAFLGFAPYWALKFSYAPSFGTNEWEFTKEQTVFIEHQLNSFKAVSVREMDGVKLLENNIRLDKNPQIVLDPTMLLSKDRYLEISKNEPLRNGVLTYILNADDKKKLFIETFCYEQGMEHYSVINPLTNTNQIAGGQGFSIEQWLAGFRDAEFVMTDSFHAVVFSIIYNKPFWVFENTERGNSRIYSLLSMFGCEDRFILKNDDYNKIDWMHPIDWTKINETKDMMVNKSVEFLKMALNND